MEKTILFYRVVTVFMAAMYIVTAACPFIAKMTVGRGRKMAIVIFTAFQIGKIYTALAVGLPGCSGIPLIDAYAICEHVVLWFTILGETLSVLNVHNEPPYWLQKTVVLIATELMYIATVRAIVSEGFIL